MAEAIAKIKNSKGIVNCNTGDTDGLLVNTLLEALTGTNRLNVGAYGRSTRSATNYTSAGQSIDQHLAGIDTALGIGPTHDFEGSSHGPCTLAEFNAGDRISDKDLIASDDGRLPSQDENNALVGTSGSPSSSNKYVTNADGRNTNSRSPTGGASGDLSSNYPGPTVVKLRGYSVQSGAPTANDILQYISSEWKHVAGLTPDYDSGWFAVGINGSYSKTHSLGVLPRQVQCYVSSDSGSTAHLAGWGWMYSTDGASRGTIVCDITTTALTVRTGSRTSPYGVFDTYGYGGTRRNFGTGHARVLCWK